MERALQVPSCISPSETTGILPAHPHEPSNGNKGVPGRRISVNEIESSRRPIPMPKDGRTGGRGSTLLNGQGSAREDARQGPGPGGPGRNSLAREDVGISGRTVPAAEPEDPKAENTPSGERVMDGTLDARPP
jgi:hypothetical protein